MRSAGTTSQEAVLHPVPSIIAGTGDDAVVRFSEFLATVSRNINTRMAYDRAVRSFLAWCEARGLERLDQIEPRLVATYVDQHTGAKPTIKQHLAAIRTFFDWLASGRVISSNPASSVRGPRYVVTRWKTPVLTPEQTRRLLDSIDTSIEVGLRDRALIAVMVYTFARVSSVVTMRMEDFYRRDGHCWFRLRGRGRRPHEVPAHPSVVAYMNAYLEALEQREIRPDAPLFRSVDRRGRLTSARLTRTAVLRVVKRRARAQGLRRVSCRTLRATGITTYLNNGGTLENAQALAAHVSPRTTRLYAHEHDKVPAGEIERIII